MNFMDREAAYDAEAEKILGMNPFQAKAVIIGLIKEAGWEPDPQVSTGWKKVK